MAIRELVSHKDPILRVPTQLFDFENPPVNPIELYTDLAETMIAKNGIGLAANQIGVPYSVFVIRSDPILAFFNPVIVDIGGEVANLEEGCLSFPGIYVKVPRYRRVRVRFADPTGNIDTQTFEDITAKVVQHEYEHLLGQIFTYQTPMMELALAMKKAKKARGISYLVGDLRNKSNGNDPLQSTDSG